MCGFSPPDRSVCVFNRLLLLSRPTCKRRQGGLVYGARPGLRIQSRSFHRDLPGDLPGILRPLPACLSTVASCLPLADHRMISNRAKALRGLLLRYWGGWVRTTNLLVNRNVGKYPIPVIFAYFLVLCPFLTGQKASDNRFQPLCGMQRSRMTTGQVGSHRSQSVAPGFSSMCRTSMVSPQRSQRGCCGSSF